MRSFSYDAAGLLRSVTDANGATTTFARDGRGNVTARTNATGHSETFVVDLVDRRVERYNDAEEVAERLRERGEALWADRLTRAIEEGFTATEILMALRHELGELLENGPPLDEDTKHLASSLRSDIDAVLS